MYTWKKSLDAKKIFYWFPSYLIEIRCGSKDFSVYQRQTRTAWFMKRGRVAIGTTQPWRVCPLSRCALQWKGIIGLCYRILSSTLLTCRKKCIVIMYLNFMRLEWFSNDFRKWSRQCFLIGSTSGEQLLHQLETSEVWVLVWLGDQND